MRQTGPIFSDVCECRCVWCGTIYIGRERSLFCKRTCREASHRHPYRRFRTEVSRLWCAVEYDVEALLDRLTGNLAF